MRRFRVGVLICLLAVLCSSAFVTSQYREARTQLNLALAKEDYEAAVNVSLRLRKSLVLLPLRWGTPFFLRNIAGEVFYKESEAWYAIGEKDKAQESYIKSAELFTDGRRKDRASAYYNASRIALEKQDYIRARDLLHKTLDPVSGNPHHALAKANLERLEMLTFSAKESREERRARRKAGGRPRPGFGEDFEREPLTPWAEKDVPMGGKNKEKRR